MENKTEEQVMKSRSVRACIADGYRLYTGSFKRIFRRSWLMAVVYAVTVALLGTFSVMSTPRMVAIVMMAQQNPAGAAGDYFLLMGELTLLVLLFAVAAATFASRGVSMLREHQQTGQIGFMRSMVAIDGHAVWRTWKAVLCLTLIGLIAMLVTGTAEWVLLSWLSPITGAVATGIVAIAIGLLLLPVTYTSMRYLMNDGTGFWPQLGKKYGTGLRHLGFILAVQLVATLVVVVASTFATLPAIILSEANLEANIGVLNGDPLGMPDYIVPLTAVVMLLAGFAMAYIHLSMLFPSYYMYGTIDTQEQEKEHAKNPIY